MESLEAEMEEMETSFCCSCCVNGKKTKKPVKKPKAPAPAQADADADDDEEEVGCLPNWAIM